MYEVVIVGGGPAGLSAALVLGRCRRHVLLCDAATPRNASATALHAFLTRDGTPPLQLLQLGRAELSQYGVDVRNGRVTDITSIDAMFEVTIDRSERVRAQTILFATGVCDQLPPIPGLTECYGVTVHHCPYCDGWEHRDQPLAVLGQGRAAAGLALSLKTWSDRVTLCTNGSPLRLQRSEHEQLAQRNIAVRREPVDRLEHVDGRVTQITLTAGDPVVCAGVFFSAPQTQQSDFARLLGCEFTRKGTVKTDLLGKTCIPRVYVVGDASRDVQFAIVAAAEGAKAGVAINKALQAEAGLSVSAESAHA